jgi:tetratricopeptide (TPR) repeat protein
MRSSLTAYLPLTSLVLALLSACGSPQATGPADVTETVEVVEVTPVEPVEVAPPPTAEELAAQAQAEADSAWSRATELVTSSEPGERDYAQIISLIESVLEHDPNLPDAWFNIGLMKQEQGDRSGAEEAYRRAGEVDPRYARGLANLSYLQLEDGDVQGALATIQECLLRRESEPGCNINLSILYRTGQTPPEGDVTDPNAAAIQRLRFSLLEEIDAEAYTVMAEIYQSLGQTDLARLVCENAALQGLVSASLYNRLGLLALAEEDVLRAYEAFRLATELDPQYDDAFLNMGGMAFRFRDYPTAAAAFEEVLTRRDEPAIRISYGAALRGLERYDDAEAQYQQVLTQQPAHTGALFNLGVLLQEGRQDYAQACGFYKQYLRAEGAMADEHYEDVTRRLATLHQLAIDLSEFGEMDPAVIPACDPATP